MLAVFLFWLSGFPAASPPLDTLHQDSMIISGSCWDATTGLDLPTRITVRAGGRDWPAQDTDANGRFSLRVPVHTEQLTFAITGYETVVFPVTTSGEIPNNTRFQLSVPVIHKDSQLLAGTYSPPPPPSQKTTAGTSFFQVREARSGKRLPATVCFKYPHRTYCFEVDSTKVPTAMALPPGKDIPMQVQVQGYQSYQGSVTISPDGPENPLYHVRLLPLNHTLLALAYEVPVNQQFRYEIRKPQSGTFVSSFSAAIPYLSRNDLQPNTDYQLMIYTAEDNRLVQQEAFSIKPGLNFKTIRLQKPAASTATASILHRNYTSPTYDSVVLYFDQSTYHLRQATQPTLDSISWLLIRQPGLRAQLTGHTDNVGRRELNQTLSEYRARVVAHYLKQRGVAPEQLVLIGRGPDSPAAPNDSEANKSRNRRVVVRLQP